MLTMSEYSVTRDLPRFVLDVDMYVAKYAYAVSVISGPYTALQVKQLTAWLYEAKRTLLITGVSLDSAFDCMGHEEAGNIVRAIKRNVNDKRDGYEVLRVKWPEWKVFLQDSAQTPARIAEKKARPTEITL